MQTGPQKESISELETIDVDGTSQSANRLIPVICAVFMTDKIIKIKAGRVVSVPAF